jgi:hypothetical protein
MVTPMDYQEQVAIGANVNAGIQKGLDAQIGAGQYDPGLIAAVAQALLIQLDQAGLGIVRKGQRYAENTDAFKGGSNNVSV